MRDDTDTSLTHHPHHDLAQLRRLMRAKRLAVAPAARRRSAQSVARLLSIPSILRPGCRIAIYLPFDGEIDLLPFARRAHAAGCILYAPRIVSMRRRRMEFIELPADFEAMWLRGATLRGPRINLHRRIDPRQLDIVLVPVLAFDVHGWRLGFGAGFYDRKFAFLRRPFRVRPRLIGVGYEFQRVPPQTARPWDVLVDAIVTERRLLRALD